MDYLSLLFDIVLLSFIVFTIIIGALFTLFSSSKERFQGVILLSIGIILGSAFYYFYIYDSSLWKRIPIFETFFSDIGASFGVIVIVSIIAVVLISSENKKDHY